MSELAVTTGSPALASADGALPPSSTLGAAFWSRLMGTRAKRAGEVQDDKQHDQGDRDRDPEHGDPARCAPGRSAVAAVVARVWVARRVSHVRLLCRACLPR